MSRPIRAASEPAQRTNPAGALYPQSRRPFRALRPSCRLGAGPQCRPSVQSVPARGSSRRPEVWQARGRPISIFAGSCARIAPALFGYENAPPRTPVLWTVMLRQATPSMWEQMGEWLLKLSQLPSVFVCPRLTVRWRLPPPYRLTRPLSATGLAVAQERIAL